MHAALEPAPTGQKADAGTGRLVRYGPERGRGRLCGLPGAARLSAGIRRELTATPAAGANHTTAAGTTADRATGDRRTAVIVDGDRTCTAHTTAPHAGPVFDAGF